MGSSSLCLLILCVLVGHFMCAADPTDGFTAVALRESDFEVQRPYNKPVNQRYSYIDGVRRLWVFSKDRPHSPNSNTEPRTEIRILGHDYSSGVWQFEGYFYVPKGTSGVSVMQIFGSATTATTMQLRVYNGNLQYYRSNVVVSDIYNKWLRLNVIHDVDAGKVKVFIDGVQKIQVDGRGTSDFYFKFGVYAQNTPSFRMESRWRDIKIYKK